MRIAYDCELMRPGCVLLQAALGGDVAAANLFPAETWLLAPTEGLKLYPVTRKQLRELVRKTEHACNPALVVELVDTGDLKSPSRRE